MNLEQQVAEQVRKLSDEQLANMALNAGFTLTLIRPIDSLLGGKSNGKKIVKATGRVTKKKVAKKSAGGKTTEPHWKALAFLQKQKSGVGIADITVGCGLARSEAQKAIKLLLGEKKAFRAGKARWTRYGNTQKKADAAAKAASG